MTQGTPRNCRIDPNFLSTENNLEVQDESHPVSLSSPFEGAEVQQPTTYPTFHTVQAAKAEAIGSPAVKAMNHIDGWNSKKPSTVR